jgi:hypothetical protein
MGDAVKSLIDNLELITDCCRYSEGILTEKQVRQKYHLFDESTWTALGSDEALLEKSSSRKSAEYGAARQKGKRPKLSSFKLAMSSARSCETPARHPSTGSTPARHSTPSPTTDRKPLRSRTGFAL